jgi:hypothetical protein
MKTTRIAHALVIALAASVALAGCNRGDNAAAEAENRPSAADTAATAPTRDPSTAATTETLSEPGPLATPVNVNSVTVGSSAAADRSVSPKSTFAAGDDIVVSVRTDGTAQAAEITARLTYQDGQVAGEESASLSTTGAETTNITFSNANPWPAGRYTVQVLVDSKPAGMSQDIQVR